MRSFFLLIALCSLTVTPAAALSIKEAQACVNTVLHAYNTRSYPQAYIDEVAIVSGAIGPAMRTLTKRQSAEILRIGIEELRASFEDPTGRYRYKDVVVEAVTLQQRGQRVTGKLHLTSPSYTGSANFLALTHPNSCRVTQVRIMDLESITNLLGNILRRRADVRRIISQ